MAIHAKRWTRLEYERLIDLGDRNVAEAMTRAEAL